MFLAIISYVLGTRFSFLRASLFVTVGIETAIASVRHIHGDLHPAPRRLPLLEPRTHLLDICYVPLTEISSVLRICYVVSVQQKGKQVHFIVRHILTIYAL